MLSIKKNISQFLNSTRKAHLFLLSAVLSFPLALVASMAWFTVLGRKYSFRTLAYAAPFAFIIIFGIIWFIAKNFFVKLKHQINMSRIGRKQTANTLIVLVILTSVASAVWINIVSGIFDPPQYKHEVNISPLYNSTGEICILEIVNDEGIKINKANNNIIEVFSTGAWVSQKNDCQFFIPGSSTGSLKFNYIGPLDNVLTFRLESNKEAGELLVHINGVKASIFNLNNKLAGHTLRHLSLNHGASMIAWNMIGTAGLTAVILVILMIMINHDFFLALRSNKKLLEIRKKTNHFFLALNHKKKFLDLCAIILIIASIVLFFRSAGTVTSGYHFTDDHEIIRITDDLSKESIFTVATKWIKGDMNIRFRPMYYFHRILESKIFGVNFTAWSVYTIFLLLTSLLCFYYGMRKLKYSIFESFCFLILVFIGPQMSIWWRLGPNETIGMVFLGMAFYFMVSSEKGYLLNTYLFSFFLICASLCKESFTIIIPAFLFFKIWHEKELYNLSVKKAVLKNRELFIPFAVMIINLLIIVFVVGTNSIGYAGVDSDIFNLFKGILSIIKQAKEHMLIVVILFCIICFELNDKRKIFLKNLIFPFLICILIVTPNLILYAKSGMSERYLLPSLIGVAFIVVSFIKETRQNLGGLRSVFLATTILVFSILPTVSPILYSARAFASEGNQIGVFISAVINNYEESSDTLLVADPVGSYEWSNSINIYLSKAKDINIYAYAIENPKDSLSDFEKNLTANWYSWFKQRKFTDMQGKPNMILFLDKTLAENFFYESGIQKEGYINILNDTGYADYRYAIFMENK